MEQTDHYAESGFHRCTSDKIDSKLEEKINGLIQSFNDKSEIKKLGVSVLFNKTLKLSRQEKPEILDRIKQNFPRTVEYLANNSMDYFPLGSCGNIVTEATISQIRDMEKIDEIKKLEFTPYDLSVYSTTFKY